MKKILRRPVFWIVAVVVLFVVIKAPADASALLRLIGHILLAVINGLGSFLRKL